MATEIDKHAEKVYIDANTLHQNSLLLARQIWDSGFRPNFIVGFWRGGTPPAITIHEFLRVMYETVGLPDPYSTAIKTQSYRGLKSGDGVDVKGIEHVMDVINSEDRMLLVDDVFDTGKTIKEVLKIIREKALKNCPEIRTAMVYFKPDRNETDIKPDYYQVADNRWLVFPHELAGLTREEIKGKGDLSHKLLFGE